MTAMPEQGRELYREFTNWALWVHVILWGAIGGSALASPWPGSGLLLLCAGLIHVGFGGLLVKVEREGVRVGLGRATLFRSYIPFTDVTALESVTYRPLRDFGGWGIRGSRRKRVWSARGNQAVIIHTRDDRQIYIGSDDPSKLESRIRNAMSVGGFRPSQGIA